LTDSRIFKALTDLDGAVNRFDNMDDKALEPLRDMVHQAATFHAGKK
jgi:hypothetical protein